MSFSAASQTAKENPPKMQYGVYIHLHHEQNFVLIKISKKFSFLLPWSESCSIVSNSLQPHELYSWWNSLGQNTGVGSLSLLQEIFPIQGLNPGLPHCRQILYQLSHKGSPNILECIAYLFSSRSSWPRNPTGVSCIAGRFLTNWAIREALHCLQARIRNWFYSPIPKRSIKLAFMK